MRRSLIVLTTDTLLPDDKKIDVTEIAAEQPTPRHFGGRQAPLEFKSMPSWTGSCRDGQ